MTDAIGPKEYVECVKGGAPLVASNKTGENLTVGNLYFVEELYAHKMQLPCAVCGKHHPHGLILKGMKTAWCPSRFKPIYKPRATLTQELMTPVPALPHEVLVDA